MLRPDDRHLVDVSLAAYRGESLGVATSVRNGRAAGLDRRSIEEALLQGALYFGFPRALSAFQALEQAWPGTPTTDPRPTSDQGGQRSRGEELFERIYGEKHGAVRSMLHGLHPDLEAFVLECAYGRVLARDGLQLSRRELCATAVLAAMRQEPQLIGHARAAIGLGLDREDLRWVLDRAQCDAETVERLMRRILRED